MNKKCTKCKEIKDIDLFSNDKQRKDGKRPSCRFCAKNRNKLYRSIKVNLNREKERSRLYYLNRKKSIQAKRAIFRKNNPYKEVLIKNKDKYIKYKLHSLKNNKTKIDPLFYLMCSQDFFLDWLGVTNDNINLNNDLDHIVPLSFAKNHCEFSALNHYSNFQLISRKKNRVKGNRNINFQSISKVLGNHPMPELINLILEKNKFEIKFNNE